MLIAVASLSIAAPVLACPNMEHGADQPKTADTAKDAKDGNGTTATAKAKAKDAPKEAPKPADTAKSPATAPKDQPKKPGDKVSIK